jgi:lipoyl(octanoyl) transferase
LSTAAIAVRYLGQQDYQTVWQAMRAFTQKRSPLSQDELWIVEHPPVFTLGQAGKKEHLLQDTEIPVIRIDRGGQITYHAPGQILLYTLIDLKRSKLNIKGLIHCLEQSVIQSALHLGLNAHAHATHGPGVYINNEKIASIGLRISRGCSYHGMSVNIDMVLSPYALINPCGHPGLKMTNLKAHLPNTSAQAIKKGIIQSLQSMLEAGRN